MTRRNFFKNALLAGAAGLILPPSLIDDHHQTDGLNAIDDGNFGIIVPGKIICVEYPTYHQHTCNFHRDTVNCWHEVLPRQLVIKNETSFIDADYFIKSLPNESTLHLCFPFRDGSFYSGRFFLKGWTISNGFAPLGFQTLEWQSVGEVRKGHFAIHGKDVAIISQYADIFNQP